MSRWLLRAEVLFVHATTGLLFAALSGLLIWAAATEEPWLLALVAPLTAFCAWGWWYEYTLFRPILSGQREADDGG